MEISKKNSQLSYICPDCYPDEFELLASQKITDLSCSNCNQNFSATNEILRFTEIDNYASSFGFQWNKFRKTQLDSHIKKPISESRLYEITEWKNDLDDQNILEAGCGAGRFTEILLKTKANIYSFDYSNSVEANLLNNGNNHKLKIFQGDIYKIPFKDESFDHVLCLGVLQHTPNPRESFIKLASKVKKGGFLYIDIYARKLHHLFQWKYLLRPVTKRLPKKFLFSLIKFVVPILLPPTKAMKYLFGKYGARLMPIKEHSELELGKEHETNWSILDTFDMYSPEHDHPKGLEEIEDWFQEEGFSEIKVSYGKNGVIARAKK